MKGFIFTEFMDFIEHEHGPDMLDDVIEAADLPNDGAFTAVGTYPHEQFAKLVGTAARAIDRPSSEVLIAFGKHLCNSLIGTFPHLFNRYESLFELLSNINEIHESEVRKLHRDAELPSFSCRRHSERFIELDYVSCRAMEPLALGMLKTVADFFDEEIEIGMHAIQEEGRKFTRFSIRR